MFSTIRMSSKASFHKTSHQENTYHNFHADLHTMLSEKVTEPSLRALVMAQSLCCACQPWNT